MSVQVNKGAVKFHSIMDMARSLAGKTNEPINRVYIRLWKRMKEAEQTGSVAFHKPTRKYVRKVQEQQQVAA